MTMSMPNLSWKEHVTAMKAFGTSTVSVDHLHGEFAKVLDTVEEIKQEKVEAAEEAKRHARERRLREEELRIQAEEEALVEKKAMPGMQDPAMVPPESATKARSRKKKKGQKEDVFHDFGKEHDDAPIQETKKNGMVFYKLNYKRYWQSDRDLQRWAESLGHNIRHEKLLFEVRNRWAEDLLGDRMNLKIQHNALVRSRTQERLRPNTGVPVALQLKDLQKQIAPKDNKKKRVMAALAHKSAGGIGGMFGGFFGGDESQALDDFGELSRGDGQGWDETGSPSAARSEAGDMPDRQSISACSSRLGMSTGKRMSQNSQLELQELADCELPEDEGDLIERKDSMHGRMPQMPQTMALLLFRNADRLHTGETLFIKRWPPAGGLKELLQLSGQATKPVVAPARALYDVTMKPIMSLEEVQPGGTYLVKGLEGFDPPKLFFKHQQVEVPSLRTLARAKQAVAGDRDIVEQFSQVPSLVSQKARASIDKEPKPTMQSPPWLSQEGLPQTHQRMRQWQLNDHLQNSLSWSCTGPPHRHYFWDEWTPVLNSSYNSHQKRIDRFASTSSG